MGYDFLKATYAVKGLDQKFSKNQNSGDTRLCAAT